MPQFDDILKKIEQSVNRFNRRIPAAQKGMLQAIEEDLRGLDVSNGNVKATVKNLSLIARIKNRMTSILLTDEYKDEVKEFAKSFNEVTALQNQYWKSVESTFKPRPLLEAIKKDAITDTVNKLTEAGIGVNIGDKVSDILRTNITTGGSYSSLTDELRQYLTTTNTPGGLEKYAKQITTDALNQYNATYTQTVSSDLNFEWFKYSNTDIETSRPFCDAMTDQPYFHISEIPAKLRAEGLTYVNKKGDRVPVPIYAKTGLPHGMIPGTDASNFQIRRGGYNCGHQVRPISAGLVPADVKSRVMATPAYIRWAAQQRKDEKIEVIEEPPKVPPQQLPVNKPPQSAVPDIIKKELIAQNKVHIDKLKESGFDTSDDLLQYMPPNSGLKIAYASRGQTAYNPATRTVQISKKDVANSLPSFKKRVIPHEVGHAIHNENGIITFTKVDPNFAKMRDGLRQIIKGRQSELNDHLFKLRKEITRNESDELTVMADIVAALTSGRYGWGHQKSYYNKHNLGDMEIFANGIEFYQNGNKFADSHPLLTQVTRELRQYISDTLKTIKESR
jgi:hypothetical protein